MSERIYMLVLPRWRPPLQNEYRGRHWSVAHRLRCTATDILAAHALQQRVPRATGRRRLTLSVRLAPRQKRWDRDASDKLLLDALINAGLLIDDSDRGLDGRMEVDFHRGTAEDWGCVLYLTDLEN